MIKKDYTNEELLGYIDHTLLKPFATWKDIKRLCDEAIEYKTASVCIPPAYVKQISDTYGDKINICTVIGFPLGYNTKDVKVAETKAAIAEGADEIDMVINITDVKNHLYDKVEEEIKAIKEACGKRILKVIIETCYLNDDEKIAVCKAITNAKADYIKTSTGFGTAGATLADIKLFKENIGPDVKIKAAGGVKTKEDIIAFVKEGCSRIGASSGVAVLK